MNSMLQVANGILWAAAIVSSAPMRAPSQATDGPA